MIGRRIGASAALAVLLFALLGVNAPAARAWTEQRTLDGAGGANGRTRGDVGRATASVIHRGQVHLFYAMRRGDHSRLRHAVFASPTRFETVDGTGEGVGATSHSVGGSIAAASYDGILHVIYEDVANGDLRHAWFDGGWRRETLDTLRQAEPYPDSDAGGVTAIVYDGILQVVYEDVHRGNLRLARFDGAAWMFSVLDGDDGPRGRTAHDVANGVSSGVWGGHLHVVYAECDPAYGCGLGWVRDAVWDGSRWTITRAYRVNAPAAPQLAVLGDDDVVAGGIRFDETCGSCETPSHFVVNRWDGASWLPAERVTAAWNFALGRAGTNAVAAADSFFGYSYYAWIDGELIEGPEARGQPIGVVSVGDGVWFFWSTYVDGRSLLAVSRGP